MGTKKPFAARLDFDLKLKLKLYCVKNKITIEDFIEQAIREKLNWRKK